MMDGSVNIHIYGSDFYFESKVFRTIGALEMADLFDRFIMLGWQASSESLLEEKFSERAAIWRVRLLANHRNSMWSKVVQRLRFCWKACLKVRSLKVDVITCHSLADLPLCFVLKLLKRAKLVYDAHELETETQQSKGLRKVLSKFLERALIRFANEVIVVSPSIAKWYQSTYGLSNVSCIKNIPGDKGFLNAQAHDLKSKLSVSSDGLLFIYQGIVGHERGVERTLRLFSNAQKDRHILFLGYGDLVGEVKKYAKKFSNIHYHPAVKISELASYTSAADVGLQLISPTCKSYYYCLPNKTFEYLFAGLPLLSSRLLEIERLVDDYHCGWLLPEADDRAIDFINKLTLDKCKFMAAGVSKAAGSFSWEQESNQLISIYKRVIGER
jgi:glycosyltransferase involved in cell wall biosynthesis